MRRGQSGRLPLAVLAASLVCWAPLAQAQQAIPSFSGTRALAPDFEPAAGGLRTPNLQPLPVIEAGMHTALINSIAVDAGGHWAVTASDDKTARVWDLASGQQQVVLRVPIGPGPEGKLYAAALTPDGTLVAVGGYTGSETTGSAIHLFDRASGRLLHTLPRLPDVVRQLTFSRDGRWLAAALASGGVRLFERGPAGRWQPRAAAAPGSGGISTSVAFAPDGRLLVSVASEPGSSAGGELQLYGPPSAGGFALLQRRQLSGGREPFSVRFSPDGRKIAVGFHDSPRLQLLDGRSLAPLASPDQQGLGGNGNLARVAWSPAGDLLAAGSLQSADGSFPLVIWPAGGGAPRLVPLGLRNTVMALEPLADGRLLAGGAGPAWVLLDANRQPLLFRGPPVLDHRDAPGGSVGPGGFAAFRLAPDGHWIEFRAVARTAAGTSSRLARFDLIGRGLSSPIDPAGGGLAPRRSGLPIAPATLPPEASSEEVRSQAISSDGGRVARGSEWNLRLLNRSGRLLWRTSVPGAAWLVNLSPDGRFVLAALGDGSIRWYRSGDGSEALALFVHPDGRWLLWTPEGFYDASPATATTAGGASLLGYHLNQGREREASFVGADQLQQNFFRPDLIARRLAGDEGPITAVAKVGDVRQLLKPSALPPEIRLISTPQRLASGEVEITYELVDRGGGIGPVELRLNGAVIEGRANPPVAGINRTRLALPRVKVPAELRVLSRSGVASLPVTFEIEGATAPEPPTLHVLAVGVTAYRDSTLRQGVKFAAADAEALVATLRRPGLLAGARLGTVKRLTDGDASRERIRQELQAMAAVVKPGDRFVLYLAGHGTAFDGEYYFLTQELDNGSEAAVRRQALSGSQLREQLSRIQASGTLLLFDTCSSGTYGSIAQQDLKASVKRFEQLDGRLMLAAAGDRRMALESPFGQSGIFTAVVIDGLLGKADLIRDRVVKASELLGYVVETVPEVTARHFNGVRQEPYQSSQGNFPLTQPGSPPP